nr:hypothetical protein [Tanacetum cinerariifolium]
PADGGDDGDDEEESSEDEEDDEMDVKADEEEEEQPAPADSVVVASTSPPSSQLPSASRREDRPEVTLPPRKRFDIALGPKYEVGESSSAAAAARLAGGFRLMEIEAKMSREAWVRATDTSDLVHGEVISLRTTVLGQISVIRELQAADRRRQTVISEVLRMDHRRSTETSESRTALQGQITALQGQKQMAPRRTTRSTADQETVNATTVTNAQLQTMIDQGVTAALAARDALRSTNGDDSHNSGTGVRRTERAARECTYTDFLKYDDGQILPSKRDHETRNGNLGAKGKGY